MCGYFEWIVTKSKATIVEEGVKIKFFVFPEMSTSDRNIGSGNSVTSAQSAMLCRCD